MGLFKIVETSYAHAPSKPLPECGHLRRSARTPRNHPPATFPGTCSGAPADVLPCDPVCRRTTPPLVFGLLPAGRRILRRLRSEQGERTRRGHHAVGRIYVVFDENGDAVKWSAHSVPLAFPVECIGDRERVGIDLNHAVNRGTSLIDLLDASEVVLDDAARRVLCRLSLRLEVR
jgi:hypothetical protein